MSGHRQIGAVYNRGVGTVRLFSGSDRAWHAYLLAHCPRLTRGPSPPIWARSAHMQNLLAFGRSELPSKLRWEQTDVLTTKDGGTVSVQWTGLGAPPETPVLVGLHTICGNGDALRTHLSPIHEGLGWVVAACNRRGHGLPLTTPRVNTMGSTDDLRRQLAFIRKKRPQAPLFGLGVSAGSALLVRYLGEEGEKSLLTAAIALSPAYDIETAFDRVHPRYSAFMTQRLIQFFLERHRDHFEDLPDFVACSAAQSLAEFHRRCHTFAGFDSSRAFFEASNPMVVANQVITPTLVINAADDPICLEHNVYENLPRLIHLPRVTVALSSHGGHCGFYEGFRANRNWADELSIQYFKATAEALSPSRDHSASVSSNLEVR